MYLGGNRRWVPLFGGASMHKDLTIQNHVYRTYSIHIAMTILILVIQSYKQTRV